MSNLKEVNDEWILRRLERWGKRDGMPFLGPAKGALLQRLVADKAPKRIVEVGTMAGGLWGAAIRHVAPCSALQSLGAEWLHAC